MLARYLVAAVDYLTKLNSADYIEFGFSGKPAVSQNIFNYVCLDAWCFPALTGAGLDTSNNQACLFKSLVAATASTTFTLKKNGASIGTANFAAAATTATFTVAADANFVSGDILTVTAPGSQDTTLADLSFSLGRRS